MKTTIVAGGKAFLNVEKMGGARKTLMSVRANLDGVNIELASYRGGKLEVYQQKDGIYMFCGYLPDLEATTDVWGNPFPGGMIRDLWYQAWHTQAAAKVLEHTERWYEGE